MYCFLTLFFQVRAKRLAKLSSSAPAPAGPSKPEVSSPPTTPSIPRPQSETFQNRELERVAQRNNPPPPPPKSIVDMIVMPPEDWENEAISKIMLVTLDVFCSLSEGS